jgi:hypothetical protein
MDDIERRQPAGSAILSNVFQQSREPAKDLPIDRYFPGFLPLFSMMNVRNFFLRTQYWQEIAVFKLVMLTFTPHRIASREK